MQPLCKMYLNFWPDSTEWIFHLRIVNTEPARVSKMKNALEDAGFVVEAEGDVLAHPEDDHTQMVFGPIRGKTDRFVLKLRKPG